MLLRQLLHSQISIAERKREKQKEKEKSRKKKRKEIKTRKENTPTVVHVNEHDNRPLIITIDIYLSFVNLKISRIFRSQVKSLPSSYNIYLTLIMTFNGVAV